MAVFSSMAGLLGGFDPVCVFEGGKMVAKHAISVHKRLPGFFPYLFEPHHGDCQQGKHMTAFK